MNVGLKAVLQTVFDVVKCVKHALEKQDFVTVLIPDLYKFALDLPAVVQNWENLKPEIEKLMEASTVEDADLIAFVISQLSGVSTDEHAKKVIAAALDFALVAGQKGLALKQAIESA